MTQLSAIFILLISTGNMNFQSCFAEELPHPGPRSTEQADFLFKEATEAQDSSKVDLAIEDYKKIIKTYPLFPKRIEVYRNLMACFLFRQKYDLVLMLGEEVLRLHPEREHYTQIQILRAEAQLGLGKAGPSKVIVEELLKSKPSAEFQSQALVLKAEALSQLGKDKEAFAALDAAGSVLGPGIKGTALTLDESLKIRARACSSRRREVGVEALDYFHEKNICFKEAVSLAGKTTQPDAAPVWCDRFQGFNAELKKATLDKFTREKLQKELNETKALVTTWKCE